MSGGGAARGGEGGGGGGGGGVLLAESSRGVCVYVGVGCGGGGRVNAEPCWLTGAITITAGVSCPVAHITEEGIDRDTWIVFPRQLEGGKADQQATKTFTHGQTPKKKRWYSTE